MTLGETHANIGSAVFELVGLGSIQDRLAQAWISITKVSQETLPTPLQERHEAILQALTAHGQAAATLARMPDDTALKIAREIVILDQLVTDYLFREQLNITNK